MSKLIYAQVWQSGKPRCHHPECPHHLTDPAGAFYVINRDQVIGFCSAECLSSYSSRYRETTRANSQTRKRDVLRELGYRKLKPS